MVLMIELLACRNLNVTFLDLQDQTLVMVVAGMRMNFPKMKAGFADILEMSSSFQDGAKSGSSGKGSLVDHLILMMIDDFQMTDVRR